MTCKLCGGPTRHYLERNSFEIVRCTDCGFMFAPLPDGFNPRALYREEYFVSDAKEGAYGDYDAMWERCLRRLYAPRLLRIECYVKVGTLLDIGCATGRFLELAQRRRWQVAGVELEEAARTQSSGELGVPVYASLEEVLAHGQRYDCVTMFEVLEHLDDPVTVLRQLVDLLKPTGILALATPNCDRPGATEGVPINIWFHPPAHLSYFNQASLRAIIELSGFRVIALEGLKHYSEAMAGALTLPDRLVSVLQRLRPGKRPLPRGALGKLLKRYFANRPSVYRCERRELPIADVFEVYAKPLRG